MRVEYSHKGPQRFFVFAIARNVGNLGVLAKLDHVKCRVDGHE